MYAYFPTRQSKFVQSVATGSTCLGQRGIATSLSNLSTHASTGKEYHTERWRIKHAPVVIGQREGKGWRTHETRMDVVEEVLARS